MKSRIVFVWLVLQISGSIAYPQTARIERANLHGGGWKSDGKSQRAAQRWTLDVKRAADDTVSGRVILADSPLASAGNVRGHIVGTNFSGSVTDDDGNLVAKLAGRVSKQGIDGTYTDRTGETGEWHWEGALPE